MLPVSSESYGKFGENRRICDRTSPIRGRLGFNAYLNASYNIERRNISDSSSETTFPASYAAKWLDFSHSGGILRHNFAGTYGPGSAHSPYDSQPFKTSLEG